MIPVIPVITAVPYAFPISQTWCTESGLQWPEGVAQVRGFSYDSSHQKCWVQLSNLPETQGWIRKPIGR